MFLIWIHNPELPTVPMHTPSIQPYTAKRRVMWLWGVGTVADAFMIQTFALVLPIFNTGFGLDAVLLSWAVMIPRVLDGLLDPIIGNWSDNAHTRWGRRKPFLTFAALLGGCVVAGIWWANPNWPKMGQFAYVMAFATVYYTAWGIYYMSHVALGYELTDDYDERSRVMAIRNIFLQSVMLLVSWVYPLALNPVFGGEINGIRTIGAVLAVLIIVAGLIPVIACKERFAKKNHEPVPIFRSIKETLKIGSFRIYLAMRFCSMFGFVVFNQLIFYINVYYVCSGDKKMATTIIGIATAITVGVTLLVLPVLHKVSRKIGKRSGVIIGASGTLLQACLVPFLYTPDSAILRGIASLLPGLGLDVVASSPYLQLVNALFLAPVFPLALVFRDAIVPDICDVDELNCGKRREGLFTAVISFVYKMEVSLCVVAVGYLISFSGFDQKALVQTEAALDRLQWFAYAPNIVFAALALIFAMKFPITPAYMANVRRELDARSSAVTAP